MKNILQAYWPSYLCQLWFWPPLILGGSVISAGTIHDLRQIKVPGTGPLWNPWLYLYPDMWSCFPSIVKSWPKQYCPGQDSIVCYWKSGPMLLSLHILQWLMQNRQTCQRYLRLWKNVLICQWMLTKSMLSKHLINNFMR